MTTDEAHRNAKKSTNDRLSGVTVGPKSRAETIAPPEDAALRARRRAMAMRGRMMEARFEEDLQARIDRMAEIAGAPEQTPAWRIWLGRVAWALVLGYGVAVAAAFAGLYL